MGFSRTLAVWSSDLSFDDLPEVVVPWVKAAVLDFLAVSAAGSQADGVEILSTYVQGQYAKGSATVIGQSNRMSAEAAALLNGTISHWEEYDDATFGMWGHPSVALMPALFAVAETEGGSGKDFIVSYVAGFEACAKVGRLITPQQVKLGWPRPPLSARSAQRQRWAGCSVSIPCRSKTRSAWRGVIPRDCGFSSERW